MLTIVRENSVASWNGLDIPFCFYNQTIQPYLIAEHLLNRKCQCKYLQIYLLLLIDNLFAVVF